MPEREASARSRITNLRRCSTEFANMTVALVHNTDACTSDFGFPQCQTESFSSGVVSSSMEAQRQRRQRLDHVRFQQCTLSDSGGLVPRATETQSLGFARTQLGTCLSVNVSMSGSQAPWLLPFLASATADPAARTTTLHGCLHSRSGLLSPLRSAHVTAQRRVESMNTYTKRSPVQH